MAGVAVDGQMVDDRRLDVRNQFADAGFVIEIAGVNVDLRRDAVQPPEIRTFPYHRMHFTADFAEFPGEAGAHESCRPRQEKSLVQQVHSGISTREVLSKS